MKSVTGPMHTPGEWTVEYGAVYAPGNGSAIRILLADRDEPRTSPCERDANIQLAGAAPALAEACRAFLKRHHGDGITQTHGCRCTECEQARAALKLAGV